MSNQNDNDAVVGAVVGVGLLAALAGLIGVAVHSERSMTPAQLAAREATRREAELRRRAEEERRRLEAEARRQELAAASVQPLRSRGEFDGLLEALLTGKSSSMSQTVALYAGYMRGAPSKVLTLSVPTQVGNMLLTPTESGVTVQHFGTFGPEKTKVKSGDSEYIFGQRLTVAVL